MIKVPRPWSHAALAGTQVQLSLLRPHVGDSDLRQTQVNRARAERAQLVNRGVETADCLLSTGLSRPPALSTEQPGQGEGNQAQPSPCLPRPGQSGTTDRAPAPRRAAHTLFRFILEVSFRKLCYSPFYTRQVRLAEGMGPTHKRALEAETAVLASRAAGHPGSPHCGPRA